MYIHCAKCKWEQDDFYSLPHFDKHRKLKFSLGYNPISKFISSFSWLWYPRYIEIDGWCINQPLSNGLVKIHSWKLLWYNVKKYYRCYKNMKWLTYNKLKNDKNSKCPHCGLSGKGWYVTD